MKCLPGSVQGLARAGAPMKPRGPGKRHAVGTLSPKGLRPRELDVPVRIRAGACPGCKPGQLRKASGVDFPAMKAGLVLVRGNGAGRL